MKPRRIKPEPVAVSAETLKLPASKPRNRLAADPLLRKSGAHTDSRRKRTTYTDKDFVQAMDDVHSTLRKKHCEVE